MPTRRLIAVMVVIGCGFSSGLQASDGAVPGTQPATTVATASMTPAESTTSTQPADRAVLRERSAPAMALAVKFLLDHQASDGGWPGFTEQSDPAVSALVAEALIRHPAIGPGHPAVQRAVRFILSYRQTDGGIYDPQLGYANYSTSVVLSCLAAAKDPSLQPMIDAAQRYLTGLQWDDAKQDNEGRPIDESHPWYGGAGYGRHKRPDLSNTQMMVEALHASGLPADHPAYRKAMRFVARCQMLSDGNDMNFARGASDGGFIYTPANNGESMAGTRDDEGTPRLRSYGSMTYAAFKSMLYAQVSRDDPRVKAAWGWIRGHYTLDSNPNMPGEQSRQGLYYFYRVFAKALAAWGEPTLVDAAGVTHDWRAELCEALLRRQGEDGAWINDADRWMEGNPYLVTAYALSALQTALE